MLGLHHFSTIQAAAAFILPVLAQSTSQNSSLDTWIEQQTPIAFQGILNNIGPKADGAEPGIVVASPSRSNPNYYYTWTRDAALTYKCLVDALIAGEVDIESSIQDYVVAQARLQAVTNPSGDTCSGGLAEPKFNVNETAFTGSWGRPQRDGPALRATTLAAYAKILLDRGNTSLVSDAIWPVVQNDLSYIAQNWNSSTFDLWEEIDSSSFFTTAVQYRALVEGSALAQAIGKSCTHCDSQAPLLLCFLQTYWTGEYAIANTGGGRSGKDINSVLTSVHLFDLNAGCDDLTFQPCSDRALANHRVVTDSFRGLYPINNGIQQNAGVAVGRYPEDVYQGGHPWYLSDFAAAEQLYYAIAQWKQQSRIAVSNVSLPFFDALLPNVAAETYTGDSQQYQSIVAAVQQYADGYLAIAQKYTPSNGALAEQFSRNDGTPLSARDLTWSYAAFVTARNARAGMFPPSWGAQAASVPSKCTTGSASGPCSTPTQTIWPGRPSSSSPPCSTPSLTSTKFTVLKQTAFGETVLISGNSSELGDWQVDSVVALDASQYSAADPVWQGTIELHAGSSIEYKYLLRGTDGSITWEADPNRTFVVPANCQGAAERADSWQ